MSKKKPTTTANIPRVGATDPTYPMGDNRRRMEQGYGRPGALSGPSVDNPLDRLRFERQQDLLKEYREVRAKKDELKLQKEVAQMKQEIGSIDVSGGGLGIRGLYNFSPQEMMQISRMPEEEQKSFYETLQNLTAMSAMTPAGAGGGAGINPIWQLMALGGFSGRGQQGLTLKDVLELQRNWQTLYQGAGRGNDQLTNQLLMKLMTETVPGLQQQSNANLQMGYQAIISQLQANQSDPLRDLEYLKKGADALGYGPQNQSVEVAKLRLQMEDGWRQKDWDYKMQELQTRRQLGMIQQIIQNVNIPAILRNVTRQQTRDLLTQPPPEPAITPPLPVEDVNVNPASTKAGMGPGAAGRRVIHYTCQGCGAQMAAPEGQPTVTCQSCGMQHQTTYSQQGG